MNRIIARTAVIIAILAILTSASLSPAFADEREASEIVRKMDQLLRGDTAVSRSKMTIINPRWTRTLEMRSWGQGEKHFFIHILAPAREKDITFLKRDNLLYQYMPSAEMRIRITPSMMLQPWMGSDFTNDDLVKESSVVNDYTHKHLGREIIDGRNSYKIECTPKPNAPVVWGKLLLWIDTENNLPLRQEYFDEKDTKIKYMEFKDIIQANDRQIPSQWIMVPLNKEGHKTIYKIESIEFNTPIPDHIFTLRNLEKPR